MWIKGQSFTLKSLLLGTGDGSHDDDDDDDDGVPHNLRPFLQGKEGTAGGASGSAGAPEQRHAIAIARLAPTDYHRYCLDFYSVFFCFFLVGLISKSVVRLYAFDF